MAEERTVTRALIIVAHPDDIEFGAGGTTATWTDAGIAVTYVIVTDGAAGSNDPNVVSSQLIQTRQQEQTEAGSCLGVTDIRFLGYPDGTLQPTLELRRDLTRIIRELRPERVVVQDPTSILLQAESFSYINHPDHRATGEASLYAVFPSAETRPIFPELLKEGLEPHHVNELWLMFSMQPNRYVDITKGFDRKIAALLCHRSQLDEESIKFIREMDAAAGQRSGYELAEEFRVMTFYNTPSAPDATT